ncbi:MAG: LLM class flavin-dependent oxidoreductase [Chloroflexota bacterium]|nr:LLM class flavin-dependent oxidoreductase [Chloroflexota bacterium]
MQLPEVEREVSWTEYVALARQVEDLGFDSLWLGDHLFYREPDGTTAGPWEAWTMLAAIAAVTSRIRLGPLVACTAFHNPAILAKQAATLDEISGGRFVLGLGAGWNETEFRAFGLPFDHRISRFEEAFTIIRTLLREGSIDFEGRFYQARDCELRPRSPTPGGPPILIGSSGDRMLRITVPYVQGWNAWFADTGNSPNGVRALRDRVDAACAELRVDPAAIERSVAVLVQLPGFIGRRSGDTPEDESAPPVRGTAEEMAAELRRYAAEGIAEVQLVVDPIDRRSLDRLGPVLERLDAG